VAYIVLANNPVNSASISAHIMSQALVVNIPVVLVVWLFNLVAGLKRFYRQATILSQIVVKTKMHILKHGSYIKIHYLNAQKLF